MTNRRSRFRVGGLAKSETFAVGAASLRLSPWLVKAERTLQ